MSKHGWSIYWANKEPLWLQSCSSIHFLWMSYETFKSGCWVVAELKLMIDEFGLHASSNMSLEPDSFYTKFCLEQILSSKSEDCFEKSKEFMDSTILLWSCWPLSHCLCLCLLIPSSLLIQTFHNTSSDFGNYMFLSKSIQIIWRSFIFDSQHVPWRFLSSQHAKAELLVMIVGLSVPLPTCRLSTPPCRFLAPF